MKSVQDVRSSWLPLPLLFLAVCSQATEFRDTTVSSESGINNSSMQLDGQLIIDQIDPFSDCGHLPDDGCATLPWIINVFAGENECLRLDLTRPIPPEPLPFVDFQMVVIDPWGTLYWSGFRPTNDPNNNDARPLVKIANTSGGWHTLLIQRDFDETGEAPFKVRYGRYNLGNRNCANPTQPMLSQQAAALGLTGTQEVAAAREARRARRNAIGVKSSSEVPDDAER